VETRPCQYVPHVERLPRNGLLDHEDAQGTATDRLGVPPVQRVNDRTLTGQPLQCQGPRRPVEVLVRVTPIVGVVFLVRRFRERVGHVTEDEPRQKHLLELGRADDVLRGLAAPEVLPGIE
jgi:hypothetical protein